MKWQNKAKIMKICASLYKGDEVYKVLQKTFGHLDANPLPRITTQIEIARWILDQGMKIEGYKFFEVGTGHNPIVPIGFFLSGAKSVITVDLHRRLDFGLMKKALFWIAEHSKKLKSIYRGVTNPDVLRERFDLLERLQDMPQTFIAEANIQYLAPADAADTGMPDGSVDYYLSCTVLEHIPLEVLKNIFIEARRILKNDGAAIHFIDLSDHFQHQDQSITKINFLRFTDEQWQRIAGNEFAYCNRLRASDFLRLFSELSFKVIRNESEMDNESKASIKDGFLIDEKFSSYSLDDLCTTTLRIMLNNEY